MMPADGNSPWQVKVGTEMQHGKYQVVKDSWRHFPPHINGLAEPLITTDTALRRPGYGRSLKALGWGCCPMGEVRWVSACKSLHSREKNGVLASPLPAVAEEPAWKDGRGCGCLFCPSRARHHATSGGSPQRGRPSFVHCFPPLAFLDSSSRQSDAYRIIRIFQCSCDRFLAVCSPFH
ncbi:hypothetical protein VTK26DRAFT_5641 [Humicola hyalothermophila]